MPEYSVADHTALSKKLRLRAEECRALAKTAADGASYLGLAKTYDAMADQEDQLASEKTNIKR
jgi:hypothetical protein